MKKRVMSVALAIALCLSLLPMSAVALEEVSSDDIVVLYTNDIHTYIDKDVTYSRIGALKNSYENVLLVDAGDHIQGTAYGDLDNGETIIELMNAAGYDLATLGNHEFDYGQEGRIKVTDVWAAFDYVSCNFYHEENGVPGENVLDSYKIFDVNGKKVAFVGITTPETITSSAPSYFQDAGGNYIYGIAAGTDGSELYEAVQSAVDDARGEGADYVIALGHLGVDPSSEPWTSENVIANTAGLDAFIDGHSHTTIPMKEVADENGDTVILTQTGSYLDAVGKLVIDGDGSISTELLTGEDLADLTPDAAVKAIEDAWVAEVDGLLGEVIGYSEITFDNYDANENRLVRKQSTNSGDFSADALYYLFDEMDMDVDVAVMNGGGIRNNAITGELNYKTCKEIHTFGNVACLLTVTGQQLLDALEWGSKDLKVDGSAESGSLLHVSGLKYTLDLSRDSTVQADDKDVWIGPPTGEYRVKDVQVLNNKTGVYEPLALDAAYNLAGYNYTLRDLGGGFAMFNDAVNVLDYVAEDYMVLANYIKSFPVDAKTGLPTITADSGYTDVTGSGRITVITDRDEAVDAYDLWVGGVQVTEDNARNVFGDGKVSYDPNAGILTLSGYTYEGDGYIYGGSTDDPEDIEVYAAAIYSKGPITIRLVGDNTLNNRFTAPDEGRYGDGVVAEDSITIEGSGSLQISGSYGVDSGKNLTIDGCTIKLETADDALSTTDGSVTIENGANVMIDAEGDGIFAVSGLTITGSSVEIRAQDDGVYVYDGSVSIADSSAAISGGADDLAFKVDIGQLILNGHLMISVPDGGNVKTFTDTYEGEEYNYDTIVDQNGKKAVSVTIEKGPCTAFTDLDQDAWYHEAVDYMLERGLMKGISQTAFAPDEAMTRQAAWMVLARASGENPSDMTEAKAWVMETGISDGSNPANVITRQQLVTMLWRCAKYKDYDVSVGENTNILSYEDAFDISEYAIPAMQWACGAGLMGGSSANLTPMANDTRSQAAALIMRFCELDK